MAQIVFEKTINLTTYGRNSAPKYVRKLMIGNDPNNDIFQYYLHNLHFNDKSSHVENASYDLTWSRPATSITTQLANSFGVKSFPTIGAIGFYTPIVGESKILIPIHVKPEPGKGTPSLSIVRGSESIQYTITAPVDVSYECYRIILTNGTVALEYVTYDTTGEVPVPGSNGTYEMYCIGYTAEGSLVSVKSNSHTIVVTNAQSAAAQGYYNKAEIDAMIQRLEGLIGS